MANYPPSKDGFAGIALFFALIPVCAGALCLTSGCRMLGYSAGDIAVGQFKSLAASVNRQNDPELVRQGLPSMLLIMDSLLADDPDNPELLRAASTAYAGYAQAFLVPRGENTRAVLLYEKAKEDGLKLLCRRSFFADALKKPFEEYEKALTNFNRADVPDMYAAANAWLGWIMCQTDSMSALSEIPEALALMKRVLALDETYADGGAHLVFGIYYAIQPPGAGRDLEKSRFHFTQAIELTGNGRKLPQVLYAEYYATAACDPELFSRILNNVLEKKGHERKDDALSNAIARERAKNLLGRKGDLF